MEELPLQMVKEDQASKILAVSKAALRKWRREGGGPDFIHCGRCVRYDMRAIERLIAKNSSANNKRAHSRSSKTTTRSRRRVA